MFAEIVVCLAVAQTPELAHDAERVWSTTDGCTTFEYRIAPSPFKPYVRTWTTPGGVNVLRDAPEDHLHHHGLMFAVNTSPVEEFWAEAAPKAPNGPRPGRQVSQQLRMLDGRAGFEQELVWQNADGAARLVERRTLVVGRTSDGAASLLDWSCRLSPPAGSSTASIVGRHYFGLGLRFPRTMDRATRFLYADADPPSELVRNDERLTTSAWCAAVGEIDGKPVTVVLFDRPTNPRRPTAYFTMTQPFAYLSATLLLHQEPLAVAAGRPLELRYAAAAWDGEIGREQIQRAYERWLAAP